jgi:hypothetical protein
VQDLIADISVDADAALIIGRAGTGIGAFG